MIRGLVLLSLVVLASPAASGPVLAPHVQVELVADAASIRAGRDAGLGIRFALEHGWHVYWRNPGDSGEAPTVRWTLPPGFSAGPIEWPAPARIPTGPLTNFGYEGMLLLPVALRVPDDLGGASTLDVRARVTWLVCDQDECIPGSALLSLLLPASTTPPEPTSASALFAAARARLPVAPPHAWEFSATATPETLVLRVRGATGPLEPPPLFFPYTREEIEHATPQRVSALEDGFRLELQRWAQATAPPPSVDGVLSVGGRAYSIAVPVGGGPGMRLEPLVLAFAGGLLLNLMPCVFPVLAIKALGLIGLAGDGRRQARLHGLVYTAGVLVSFWALAGGLLVVRAGGAPLGWGFQLQSPVVVAGLAGLFFWMALTLLGICSIAGSLMGVGRELASGAGYRGAFFSGVLATVVATPCTAPFMGTALGYALVQPPAVAFAVFTALALGLALPYVVVTLVPAVGARLPRPGRWMETLQQLLAFPLLATVVWLTWVASLQGGSDAVRAILTVLLLLGFAAWTVGRWTARWSRVVAATFVAGAIWVGAAIESAPRSQAIETARLAWEPYSTQRLGELLRQGKPVFVDFTAAWCVTCQVNERLALDTPAVMAKMREIGVVPVRADWTRPDPDIARALQRFGREGIPLYVLYTGKEEDPPRILPQLLTTEIVITELEALGRRSRT